MSSNVKLEFLVAHKAITLIKNCSITVTLHENITGFMLGHNICTHYF